MARVVKAFLEPVENFFSDRDEEGEFSRSIESFPAGAPGMLRGDGPLLQEHRQACNALDRPPRIRTFGFEHESVAAIKPGEQYFQDPICRMPFALGVDGHRAFKQQHAADEFGGGPCMEAVGIEEGQFPDDTFYFRAQVAKVDHGVLVSWKLEDLLEACVPSERSGKLSSCEQQLSGGQRRRSCAPWSCASSNEDTSDFFPKSDRRENDNRGWERHRPKHNRLTKQNSFGQD